MDFAFNKIMQQWLKSTVISDKPPRIGEAHICGLAPEWKAGCRPFHPSHCCIAPEKRRHGSTWYTTEKLPSPSRPPEYVYRGTLCLGFARVNSYVNAYIVA